MKKLLLFALIVITAYTAFSQKRGAVACCYPTATQRFAMLASNENFRLTHPNPVPMRFQSGVAKSITYKTTDGKTSTAFEWKAKKDTNNYLFVFHEWYGLNDYIKREAEKLYTDLGNVNVIAIDLYDGKVTADRNEAGKLMQAVKEDRAIAIIKGALTYAGAKARIETIGWCFGGGWSLQATLLANKQATGCVMYYGMPEQDVNRLKTLNADVLGNFANKDQHINAAIVDAFVINMNKAGKKLTVYRYDADHGFANPSNPIYNSDATQQAYARSIAFLKPRLK